MNGYYAPDWFMGPAIPEDLFCEIDSTQNLQSDLSDATTEFDDVDDPSHELLWSDDNSVKQRSEYVSKFKISFIRMDNITQFWGLQCLAGPISRKFVWHELFCALCDVLVLLKLV